MDVKNKNENVPVTSYTVRRNHVVLYNHLNTLYHVVQNVIRKDVNINNIQHLNENVVHEVPLVNHRNKDNNKSARSFD